MNFEELGLTLKQERERKGLSIAVVMEATKISRTNIVAMESGDRGTLPHPVYAKGFVKSYARYLGLDADELSMIVDREYQDEADGPEEHIYEVSPAAERAFQDGDSLESKRKSVWPLILVAIFLIGVVVLLLMNFKGKDSDDDIASVIQSEQAVSPEKTTMPAPEVEEDQNLQPIQELDEGTEGAEVGELVSQTQNEASQGKAQEQIPPVQEEAQSSLAEVETDATDVSKEVENTVVDSDEMDSGISHEKQKYDHILIIRATTNKGCWIGLWKGDETNMARDFVLKKGEPLRLMFNNPRRIRIGNAAGVTVLYNGKPYPLDNAKGNIQTLRFGME
ncbi:helix-turn-helix domain-containing protein [Pseudodesulfovibrio piezophilus]|uniref:Transcriptional regulator, XRE family n=1 Tax=Pseudodesulfovibrio piezophilus (strain DSM 21447 / JCM 15486 / C1TLV30) TaxID=1322246 RepID=M1WNP8_PSEP2|nr:helix-turn-helix domain-containing protein [Pseudodesulfovibrio piezophilus]CCH47709.1 Transcriptional regulator, XRE family [Pseudodesulfovibrio piezophilus C1TLV30]